METKIEFNNMHIREINQFVTKLYEVSVTGTEQIRQLKALVKQEQQDKDESDVDLMTPKNG